MTNTNRLSATSSQMSDYITVSMPYVQAISGSLGSGTGWSIATDNGFGSDGAVKRIGPNLFFKYVKSKLNKSEQKKLKSRLSKLQSLVKNAEEMGQKALFEEFAKMLAIVARESEAVACGYDTWINKADIEKFMNLVKESDKSRQKIVYFKRLEEFPRVIPNNIQKVIKAAQKKGVFDELWILYLDYTNDSQNIQSNKEKIRQKDPILFGRFSYDPNKFFYLADWVDEFCDLTLSSFVDTLKKSTPEYEVSEVEEIDKDLIERIKAEVKERQDRLANTNPGNFRQNMALEDGNMKIDLIEDKPKKRWFEFWK